MTQAANHRFCGPILLISPIAPNNSMMALRNAGKRGRESFVRGIPWAASGKEPTHPATGPPAPQVN